MKIRVGEAALYVLEWAEAGLEGYPEWVADGTEAPRPDGAKHLPDIERTPDGIDVPADAQLVELLLQQLDLAADSLDEYDEEENPEAYPLEGYTVAGVVARLRDKITAAARAAGLNLKGGR